MATATNIKALAAATLALEEGSTLEIEMAKAFWRAVEEELDLTQWERLDRFVHGATREEAIAKALEVVDQPFYDAD